MIICSDCQEPQFPGTLFCSECGNFLLGGASPVVGRRRDAEDPSASIHSEQVVSPPITTTKIRFILSDRQEIVCDLRTDLKIGRSDDGTGFIPDIDLTPYYGAELGVSRLHAILQQASGGVMLIDKDSTNGTYINNYQLVADKPYLLGQGDQIAFGNLLTTIFFG
ncbi:MAG: FHA domain-containing protein [Chloroflexota bacterium]